MRTTRGSAAIVGLLLLVGCGDDDRALASSTASSGGGAGGETVGSTTSGVGGGGADGPGGAGGAAQGGAGGGTDACEGTATDDARLSAAMELLRTSVADLRATGGAIAVIRDGRIEALGVTGSKGQGACDPITEDTLFQTGWISELVTAVAALDAVEDGTVSLDDTVPELVPDFSVERGDLGEVTVHHLLTNSSLIRTPSSEISVPLVPLVSVCDELATVFGDGTDAVIEAPPGSMHDENDVNNYELLGLALERADGVPFPEVISSRVLGPLGIGGAFDTETIEANDHALGRYHSAPADLDVFGACRNRDPSLGYFGSIRDVATLVAHVAGGEGEVLEDASRASILTGRGVNFLAGLFMTYGLEGTPLGAGEPGDDALMLDSYAAGFSSTLLVFPQRGLAVVALLNVGDTFAWPVAEGVARIYDPSLPAILPAEVTVEPSFLEGLVGTYQDPYGLEDAGPRTLAVSMGEDGQLVATLADAGEEAFTLEPIYAPHNFLMTGSEGTTLLARFWTSPDGRTGQPVVQAVQLMGDHGPPFFP